MSNVNHRYSSESWALDLSGKRSPLSRWTGRDVLSNETFRLSLLGAAGGVAPVVWLSGDRACFEELHKVVERYVQSGLREPLLAGRSTFPSLPKASLDSDKAASSRNSNGGAEWNAGTNDGAANSRSANSRSANSRSANSSRAESSGVSNPSGMGRTELSRDRSQFSLTAQGLLRHTLSYSSADSSSPRQMQLSTLQLADLLAVLEQWQAETLALPTSQAGQSRLRLLPGGKEGDFVIPTWGRIAASLLVALGATGSGAYLLLQNGSGSSGQVALESASAPTADEEAVAVSPGFGAGVGVPGGAFGQFPTASGPPITTQAQDGDAAFNNPLVPPQDGDVPPPPGISLPTMPLPNDSNLGQVPLPPSLSIPSSGTSADSVVPPIGGGISGSISSDLETGVSPSSGDNRFIGGGLGSSSGIAASSNNIEAPPFPEPTLQDSPLLAREAESESAEVNVGQANADVAETDVAASAPLLASEPSAESDAASAPASSAAAVGSGASEDTAASEAIATAPSVFSSPGSNRPKATTSGSSQGDLPAAGEAARVQAAAPPAPPSPQVTVAKPLPDNSQSRAVQAYLQSQWKAPAAIQDPLQYRLSVSPEGKLASVEALSPTAQLYINDAQIPAVGSTISGAADQVQSTMVVTLTPSGQVNVAVEKAIPALP